MSWGRIPVNGISSPHLFACHKPRPGFPSSYQWFLFYVQCIEMKSDSSFWWYWCYCWPSLFKLSFHNRHNYCWNLFTISTKLLEQICRYWSVMQFQWANQLHCDTDRIWGNLGIWNIIFHFCYYCFWLVTERNTMS